MIARSTLWAIAHAMMLGGFATISGCSSYALIYYPSFLLSAGVISFVALGVGICLRLWRIYDGRCPSTALQNEWRIIEGKKPYRGSCIRRYIFWCTGIRPWKQIDNAIIALFFGAPTVFAVVRALNEWL